MPVVFVHGVTVREGEENRRLTAVRDGFFAEILGVPKGAIFNPLWGDHAAKFHWKLRSLPEGSREAFGADGSTLREMLLDTAEKQAEDDGRILLDIAQRSFADAIDSLWIAGAFAVKPEDGGLFALKGLEVVADSSRLRAIVAESKTDAEFVRALLSEMSEESSQEGFGASEFYDALSEGLFRLTHAISQTPVAAIRPWVNKKVALFLGDVLTYLKTRKPERGNEIIDIVRNAFYQANKARSAGDPNLIIIGHSMGGNIAYDILSHYARDMRCDLLLTVGSQVSLFEELKLFAASDDSVPNPSTKRVAKPQNVTRWLNVLDRIDILSYAMEPVFEGVEDFEFVASGSPLSAHGSYFIRPNFYHRLRARLEKVASA